MFCLLALLKQSLDLEKGVDALGEELLLDRAVAVVRVCVVRIRERADLFVPVLRVVRFLFTAVFLNMLASP